MTIKYLIIILLLFTDFLVAIAPINITRPYDEFILFDRLPCSNSDTTIFFERSLHITAVKDRCLENITNFFADKVNIMQLYQESQDGLAALKGFSPESNIGQLAQQINIDDDNNNRGHLIPSGNFDLDNFIITQRYHFNSMSLTIALPIIKMRLKNACWRDLTKNITINDALTHELYTNNFQANIEKLSDLNIGSWARTGVGDLYIGGTWNKVYPQFNKPILKFVGVKLQAGLSLPTGLKKDIDKLLAFEFGNNGTTGIVFAGNLDLKFINCVRLGAWAQFLYLFGNTNCERVKIDPAQTDLLFLAKLPAYKKWGLTQHFDLYGEVSHSSNKLSLQVFYDYLKHDNDRLFLFSDRFFSPFANSPLSLQDWSAHSLIFNLKFQEGFFDFCKTAPAFEIYYRAGINGQNALLMNSIGAQFSLRF